MQVIIDISEVKYEAICKSDNPFLGETYEAVKNGIPLPKEHGRLIDASEIVELYDKERKTNALKGDDAFLNAIQSATTIIEADGQDKQIEIERE